MRKISIADKIQIKQILQARGVLGVENSKNHASRILQFWWYNMEEAFAICVNLVCQTQGGR